MNVIEQNKIKRNWDEIGLLSDFIPVFPQLTVKKTGYSGASTSEKLLKSAQTLNVKSLFFKSDLPQPFIQIGTGGYGFIFRSVTFCYAGLQACKVHS